MSVRISLPYHNVPEAPVGGAPVADAGAAPEGDGWSSYEGPTGGSANRDELYSDWDAPAEADAQGQSPEAQAQNEGAEADPASAQAGDAKATTPGEKRTVTVTDETGKRVKYNYDPKNVEQLDNLAKQAAGFRLMQAERDKAKREMQEFESKGGSKSAANWNSLDELYRTSGGGQAGTEAVFDRLLQGDGTGSKLQELKEKWYQERLAREEMSPSERAKLEMNELLERERKERTIRESRLEAQLKAAEERQAKLDQQQLQNEIEPVAAKYSVDGKVGSSALEQVLNEKIRDEALATLAQIAEKLGPDAELDSLTVERAFRASYKKYMSDISGVVATKAKDSQAQQKVQAQAAAAASVQRTSGSNPAGSNNGGAKSSLADQVSQFAKAFLG